MKSKLINLLLIVTSLLGYLEWSGNSHSFLFEAEAEIISRIFVDPLSVIHPFTIFPLIGQLLLLITLFQIVPNKKMTYLGMIGLGILLAFIAVIGILSTNIKIITSVIPFFLIGLIALKHYGSRIKK